MPVESLCRSTVLCWHFLDLSVMWALSVHVSSTRSASLNRCVLLNMHRFAVQTDLWVQDDDIFLQKYNQLSHPVPSADNAGDVFGVTVQRACRDCKQPLEETTSAFAGVYGTSDLLSGCDHREVFRWLWALPAFLPAKPVEQSGLKVAVAVGFHATTALRFGFWTSPIETAAQASGTSLGELSFCWLRKSNSDRPIDQYWCNRARMSIPVTHHSLTSPFIAPTTFSDTGDFNCRSSRRLVSSIGPLRYPGVLRLMAPVNFQYALAEMVGRGCALP